MITKLFYFYLFHFCSGVSKIIIQVYFYNRGDNIDLVILPSFGLGFSVLFMCYFSSAERLTWNLSWDYEWPMSSCRRNVSWLSLMVSLVLITSQVYSKKPQILFITQTDSKEHRSLFFSNFTIKFFNLNDCKNIFNKKILCLLGRVVHITVVQELVDIIFYYTRRKSSYGTVNKRQSHPHSDNGSSRR